MIVVNRGHNKLNSYRSPFLNEDIVYGRLFKTFWRHNRPNTISISHMPFISTKAKQTTKGTEQPCTECLKPTCLQREWVMIRSVTSERGPLWMRVYTHTIGRVVDNPFDTVPFDSSVPNNSDGKNRLSRYTRTSVVTDAESGADRWRLVFLLLLYNPFGMWHH